jgi:spoIIIJ-associated protein
MEIRASLEVIAPSVEEAIAQGLAELGLSEDAVEVDVLDAGSRGLFGLGSRQARIRLTVKTSPVEDKPKEVLFPIESQLTAAPVSTDEAEVPEDEAISKAEGVQEQELQRAVFEQDDMDLDLAEDVVRELLARMNVQAQVEAHYAEPDDEHSRVPLQVDIFGKDLSILIGPRAVTLNALQYIAGLVIGKELGKSVPLVIDVEGYRARRAQQVRQLAKRMADQAVKTGRRQSLEPMPAGERRLVHIELRNHAQVTTESIGEEPRRKVTIIPKR